LSLLGGLIGLGVGAAASFLASEFAGWQTQINSTSVVTAFTFSAAVGIVFGLWPARRAAGLDPIDALRYE
jgi:ABC-type antimicrobial peptide transport system permease subunit